MSAVKISCLLVIYDYKMLQCLAISFFLNFTAIRQQSNFYASVKFYYATVTVLQECHIPSEVRNRLQIALNLHIGNLSE